MSYYQQQYYSSPSTAAPIQSSFYAARQRFEQQPQTTSTPPHLRSHASNYRQYTAPPQHPLQQARGSGQQQPPRVPATGQGQPQVHTQQFSHPQSQYGQVQQYQPSYSQAQVAQRQVAPYAPPAQYARQPDYNPQRMYSYPPMPMQPQILPQPSPAQAFAAYDAFNARTHKADVQSQPQHQQQQVPQPLQTQFGRPVGAPQIAPSTSAPPGPQPRPQPRTSSPNVSSHRPLPQPGPGGSQARPRPISMPPQMQNAGPVAPSIRHEHSSSSSLSNIIPRPSIPPTTSFPSPSLSSPSAPNPRPPSPQGTLSQTAQSGHIEAPGKLREKPPLAPETAAQRTPMQRRALPPSPTAPPDLSQLQHRSIVGNALLAPQASTKSSTSTSAPQHPVPMAPSQPTLKPKLNENDRPSTDETETSKTRERTPSPQYGILDLPNRKPQLANVKAEPPSPQYGIKDLPSRTKSVVDRRKAWERAEQGMNDAPDLLKPTSPTKLSSATARTASNGPSIPPVPSPQPQKPQQVQKMPMPVVRQPQPSHIERAPSWTLPTADLEKLTGEGEKKTSMTYRFAAMALKEEGANSTKAETKSMASQSHGNPSTTQKSVGSRTTSPAKPYPFSTHAPRRSVNMDLSLDDAPPPSLRRSPSPSVSTASSSVPSIPTIKTPEDVLQCESTQNAVPMIPQINLPGDLDLDDALKVSPKVKAAVPSIVMSPKPMSPRKANIPLINFPDDEKDMSSSGPTISVSASSPQTNVVSMPVILDDLAKTGSQTKSRGLPRPPGGATAGSVPASSSSGSNLRSRGGGLVCGGCGQSIIGRIVSAMSLRWHPDCFRCCICGEHLEHVSSYEHDGKPYCHLDYHELFAPQCYSCKTPIIDERFITLDDPSLGKRTYHEQHFFCAECGDPFLAPSLDDAKKRSGPNEINIKGDGAFDVALDEDGQEVGFTVFKGHPYCEACHVRLRAPKCKACKRSIRDGMRAVEALGGKWCFECFVCAGCQEPFEEPSFFQRDKKPFCEHCFSVILRNEV